jgi:SAM-dependent methyltransferase
MEVFRPKNWQNSQVNETSKSKLHYPHLFGKYISGVTLDIGAGSDPVCPEATIFDQEHGNAQHILNYFEQESFDTVYASHCLEHMEDPISAVKDWFGLVKPGGILFIIVPDEDLYEQGHFPSIFNYDHKATFTISKEKSWSSKSINCLDIVGCLDAEVIYLRQQANNYNFNLLKISKLGLLKFKITTKMCRSNLIKKLLLRLKLVPVDQTSLSSFVLAQICFIIRKN